MKMVELFGMSAVDSPRLTGTEEGGKYRRMVDHQPGGKAQFSLSHPSLPVYSGRTKSRWLEVGWG